VNTVDWVARGIAIVSGLVGLGGLIVAIMSYKRDRSSLNVRYLRDMRLIGTEKLHAHMEALLETVPPELVPGAEPILDKIRSDAVRYDPRKRWAYIKIVNDGRRPVKFEKAGFLIRGMGPLLALDGKVTMLPEGESIEIPCDEDTLKKFEAEVRKQVYAAFAIDVLGREFFSPLPLVVNMDRLLLRRSPFANHRMESVSVELHDADDKTQRGDPRDN